MLFVENVKLAEAVGERLPNSIVYTAQDSLGKARPAKELDASRKKFEDPNSGKDIMITVSLVSEGYDYQELQTVYLYAPTNSNVRLRQRVGRVLRQSDKVKGDKKAKVVWQCCYEDQKLLDIQLSGTNLEKGIDIENIEDDIQIKKEVEKTKRGETKYLLAPAYILPLKRKNVSYKDTEIYYELLNVLSLFRSEDLKNYKGYYELSEYKIFVDDKLIEGFEQFYRQIRTDCLSADKVFSSVNEYAKYLFGNVSSDVEARFYREVKETCFYKSDVKEKDVDVKTKNKARFYISDNDIEQFFLWIIENDICMPPLYDKSDKVLKKGLLYLLDELDEGELTKGCTDAEGEIIKELAQDIVEKLDNEKVADLIEAIISLRKQLYASEISPARKEISDLLRAYGKGACDYSIAEELASLRNLISMGITSRDRFQYPCVKSRKMCDLAFMDLEDDRFVEGISISGKLRSQNTIEYDNVLIARCLIKTIFHLSVSESDVKEYGDKLITSLQSRGIKFKDTEEKNKVIGEFLMALGYEHNDKIIKTQSKLFGGDIPNIVKYVVYDKVYDELSAKVSYHGGCSKCENQGELQKQLKKLLKDFGVSSLKPLTPVEDVIYDYRPYLKAVPHYQGIKPEFLCRMVNFLAQQEAGISTFVDAFGGSGAVTMNFFVSSEQEVNQVYNDYGAMNTAFYRVLQNTEVLDKFKKRLKEFIDIVKGCKDDRNFMQVYKKYVISKGKVFDERSARDITTEYTKKNNEACKDQESTRVKRENKLRDYYCKFNVCSFIKDGDINKEEFIKYYLDVEDVLYGIRHKCDTIYHIITDDSGKDIGLEDGDLAFVFFIYNSFSDRQSFNDCYIGNFAKFCGEYEKRLDIGHECVTGVAVHRGDANKLFSGKANVMKSISDSSEVDYDTDNTVWYCDIPYSETDASDYVSEYFDVSEFIQALDQIKGHYIVSSRYNVCCQNDFKKLFWGMGTDDKTETIDLNDRKEEKFLLKRANILAFYNQFTDGRKERLDQIVQNIEDNVKSAKVKKEGEMSPLEKLRKAMNTYIKEERNRACYVIIPFTRAEEKKKDDIQDKLKGNQLYKNNVVLNENSFKRMMQNTIYSNIPVEVMVTNIEIKEEVLADREIGDGIWAIPTFKSGNDASNYFVEPIVMVVRYDKYLELQYQCLFKEEYLKAKNEKDKNSAVKLFSSYANSIQS